MSIEAEGYKPTPEEHLTDEAKREIGERARFWNEFWKKHEFYGIKMDETEQKHIEESIKELWPKAKETFGVEAEIGYIPTGITSENLMKIAHVENTVPLQTFHGLNIKDFIGHFDKEVVQMPRSALKEGYAFGYAATSMPDRNSLGQDSKSVKEWINSKENLMTFHERLVAGIKYKKEKGEAMDQERQSLYFTICPSSKFERYATGHGLAVGKGGVVELTENFRNPSFGIRRVITKK